MTVKFFPLWFKNDLELSPVAVQAVYLVQALMMAAFNGVAEFSARYVGRVPGECHVAVPRLIQPRASRAATVALQLADGRAFECNPLAVMIAFKVVGISLLCSMALLKDWAAPHSPSNSTATVGALLGGSFGGAAGYDESTWQAAAAADDDGAYGAGSGGGGGEADVDRIAKVLLLSAIYLVRTCLMNCTYPVEQSILMDFVPKATRARWTSLDSVSSFGWCGSAALGGIIADKYDYSTTFFATAGMQALATLAFGTLFFVIPRSQDFEDSSHLRVFDDGDSEALGNTSNAVVDRARVAPSPNGTVEPLVAGSIQDAPRSTRP